jgi:hypothetical protein
MKSKQTRTNQAPRTAADTPAPRRRFRIEKLEERIAPKKGGKGTHNCSSSVQTDGTGGSIY